MAPAGAEGRRWHGPRSVIRRRHDATLCLALIAVGRPHRDSSAGRLFSRCGARFVTYPLTSVIGFEGSGLFTGALGSRHRPDGTGAHDFRIPTPRRIEVTTLAVALFACGETISVAAAAAGGREISSRGCRMRSRLASYESRGSAGADRLPIRRCRRVGRGSDFSSIRGGSGSRTPRGFGKGAIEGVAA